MAANTRRSRIRQNEWQIQIGSESPSQAQPYPAALCAKSLRLCVTANYVSVQTQRLQDLSTELRPATTTQVLSKLVHKVWESKCGYLYASRAIFN